MNRRYQSLDVWRGIACLLVVIFHSTMIYWSGHALGSGAAHRFLKFSEHFAIGVPMFFVISGYCISATAEAAHRKSLPIGDYFRRRLRRIFPPFWGALLLQIVLLLLIDVLIFPRLLSDSGHAIERPWTFSAWQWIGNATLTESWRAQFFGDAQRYILGQSWTLCYEEQFYLVTGLVLFLSRGRIFYGAILVTLLTLLARPAAAKYGLPVHGTFLDGGWLMFAAGILVYWTVNYASGFLRYVWIPILGAAAAYAWHIGVANLLYSIVFAAILIVLHPFDMRIMGSRYIRPLRVLGTICYSLYLVHAPIARATSQLFANHGLDGPYVTLFVMLPIAAGLSIALGYGFWWAVERRFLNTPIRA